MPHGVAQGVSRCAPSLIRQQASSLVKARHGFHDGLALRRSGLSQHDVSLSVEQHERGYTTHAVAYRQRSAHAVRDT